MISSFPTTQWSVVLSVGDPQLAENALAELCEAYWFPLYAYVRRRGASVDDAQDVAQAFFAHLLEKHALARADPQRGRFRSFLLSALGNFVSNQRERARTDKRGGGRTLLSLDRMNAESRLHVEPAHGQTPEAIFDREWALSLLDSVMRRLHAEQGSAEKAALFAVLQPFLTGDSGDRGAAARDAGISEAALRQAVHRLRKRYRELLRDEVARTVAEPGDIDDEIRNLFAAFQS